MGFWRVLVHDSPTARILPVARLCLEGLQALRASRAVPHSAGDPEVGRQGHVAQGLSDTFALQAQSARLSAPENAVLASHQKDSSTTKNAAEPWIRILTNRRKPRENHSSLRHNATEVIRSLGCTEVILLIREM